MNCPKNDFERNPIEAPCVCLVHPVDFEAAPHLGTTCLYWLTPLSHCVRTSQIPLQKQNPFPPVPLEAKSGRCPVQTTIQTKPPIRGKVKPNRGALKKQNPFSPILYKNPNSKHIQTTNPNQYSLTIEIPSKKPDLNPPSRHPIHP